MKIAVLTPLPPTKTGVAHYASMLLPALAKRAEVRAFATLDGYRREDFDQVFYQLGNNPHHEVMYAEAMREPGVAVLHDLVLHHLIVEMTLARGDVEGYVDALRANHGEAGAAWARARAAGLHTEMGNFLLPASIAVANRSTAVIVHNRYAAERLQSLGVRTPIRVVPHPYVPETRTFDGEAIRTRLGLSGKRVIGVFGFLTSAKRAEVVLEAFRRANDSRLALLIVGEPAPNLELPRGQGIVTTGYVADEDFPAYYAAADRLVNLRYPTAGETSGTLIRAFDAGKAVAVSDYAQFAELPDECVFKVPLGEGEVEQLVKFFTSDLPDPAPAQRVWLETNARLVLTVDGYVSECGSKAAALDRKAAALPPHSEIPLFPELELRGNTLTNTGTATITTRTYGQPELRIIDGDRWLSLPCDLRPGESVELELRTEGPIYLALQGIPFVELPRVR